MASRVKYFFKNLKFCSYHYFSTGHPNLKDRLEFQKFLQMKPNGTDGCCVARWRHHNYKSTVSCIKIRTAIFFQTATYQYCGELCLAFSPSLGGKEESKR
jgi:hypothetical protein